MTRKQKQKNNKNPHQDVILLTISYHVANFGEGEWTCESLKRSKIRKYLENLNDFSIVYGLMCRLNQQTKLS